MLVLIFDSGKFTPVSRFLFILSMIVVILVKPGLTLMANSISVSELGLRWNCSQICWNQMSLVESQLFSYIVRHECKDKITTDNICLNKA